MIDPNALFEAALHEWLVDLRRTNPRVERALAEVANLADFAGYFASPMADRLKLVADKARELLEDARDVATFRNEGWWMERGFDIANLVDEIRDVLAPRERRDIRDFDDQGEEKPISGFEAAILLAVLTPQMASTAAKGLAHHVSTKFHVTPGFVA